MIFKVLYLLLFISNIVLAQEDPCQVSNGGVTAGYMCVDNKMKQADEQLNLYYKKAIKEILVEQENRIEKENIESLFRQSQRDWLALRNSQCVRGIQHLHGKVFKLKSVS